LSKDATHHALGRLGRSLAAQQESPTRFEQIRYILDVRLEVVQKDFEHMQDGVWPRDLELGQLAVEAGVLVRVSEVTAKSTCTC
jgi:hypothetical protein